MITTKRTITFKSYSEMIKLRTFEERFLYLSLVGIIGEETFGSNRWMNQMLYKTSKWKHARNEVILRDNGCDLADENHPINGPVYIHHINPITIDDLLEQRPCVCDLDNLISTSFITHNGIHYGNLNTLPRKQVTERKPNDTCLWR